jgi:hypothetical protein
MTIWETTSNEVTDLCNKFERASMSKHRYSEKSRHRLQMCADSFQCIYIDIFQEKHIWYVRFKWPIFHINSHIENRDTGGQATILNDGSVNAHRRRQNMDACYVLTDRIAKPKMVYGILSKQVNIKRLRFLVHLTRSRHNNHYINPYLEQAQRCYRPRHRRISLRPPECWPWLIHCTKASKHGQPYAISFKTIGVEIEDNFWAVLA